MFDKLSLVILSSLIPITELKTGLLLALYYGFDPLTSFIVVVLSNFLLFFPVYFGMQLFYKKFFFKIKFIQKHLEKSRKDLKPYMSKYGYIGLAIWVSTPLPMSGVYTAAALAWILGMDWKKAFAAICVGVLIEAILVLTVALGIIQLIWYK
jgi:uncharacterized membrane protein